MFLSLHPCLHFARTVTYSRAPLLDGRYSASSLLRAPPPPSRLPPISWVPSYTASRSPISCGRSGFSSCLACPCHRAVATAPPECLAASARLRQSMLPSPYSCGLGLWGAHFEATSAFTFVTARRLAITPRMMSSIGFRNLVALLPAIQATGFDFFPGGIYPHRTCQPLLTHNCSGGLSSSPSEFRQKGYESWCLTATFTSPLPMPGRG